MEHLWLHFAHYSHTFVPRDLDHLSGVAAQSFVRDLCQVMKRERGGKLTQKYRCKEIDRASIKILLYAICRRGKNVSIMFGEFLRLIYCFSTPCRNNLARCGTCILNSLRENVRIDQLVFRHVNNSDISVFKPHERCVLKQFRDFVKRFVLYKIPVRVVFLKKSRHLLAWLTSLNHLERTITEIFENASRVPRKSSRIDRSIVSRTLRWDALKTNSRFDSKAVSLFYYCGSSQRNDSDWWTSRRCEFHAKDQTTESRCTVLRRRGCRVTYLLASILSDLWASSSEYDSSRT